MIRHLLHASLLLLVISQPAFAAGAGKWNCEEVDFDAMDPVGWKGALRGPDTVEIGKPATFTVDVSIVADHVLYQQHAGVELPEGAKGVTLGKPVWPATKRKFDELLKKELDYWDGATISVPVPVTFDGKPGARTLELVVTQQACNPCVCLMPTPVSFTKRVTVTAPKAAVVPPAASPAPSPEKTAAAAAKIAPTPTQDPGTPEPGTTPAAAAASASASTTVPSSRAAVSASSSVFSSQDRMAELIKTNFLLALAVSFLGGVLISLTPCVYPMIPITVAVIGNQATKGNATASQSRSRGFLLSLVYVLGITAVYATLGVIAAKSGKEFGFAMRNPIVLLSVAAVFVALAASMFGAFQIQLPTALQTRLSSYQGSGTAGVFVTGLFAGVVAGPCTAPVLIGILLAISAGEVGVAGGFALMTSFSFGMGMLFVAIGTFSGLLSTLPRSGAWMDTVKHVFGAMLVGAALYFLKLSLPTDGQWVFALALGASLVLLGMGLGAMLRLDAEAPLSKRLSQGTGCLAAVAGVWFFVGGLASSGFGPQYVPSGDRITGGATAAVASSGHELPWIEDEAEGVRVSAATGKPMLIDFWAEDCTACAELDEHTYTDERVIDLATESFVPVKVDLSTPFGTSAERKKQVAELREKYRVLGLPKVVFIRPDGSEIDKELTVYGFVPAEQFLERMNAAKECAPDGTAC